MPPSLIFHKFNGELEWPTTINDDDETIDQLHDRCDDDTTSSSTTCSSRMDLNNNDNRIQNSSKKQVENKDKDSSSVKEGLITYTQRKHLHYTEYFEPNTFTRFTGSLFDLHDDQLHNNIRSNESTRWNSIHWNGDYNNFSIFSTSSLFILLLLMISRYYYLYQVKQKNVKSSSSSLSTKTFESRKRKQERDCKTPLKKINDSTSISSSSHTDTPLLLVQDDTTTNNCNKSPLDSVSKSNIDILQMPTMKNETIHSQQQQDYVFPTSCTTTTSYSTTTMKTTSPKLESNQMQQQQQHQHQSITTDYSLLLPSTPISLSSYHSPKSFQKAFVSYSNALIHSGIEEMDAKKIAIEQIFQSQKLILKNQLQEQREMRIQMMKERIEVSHEKKKEKRHVEKMNIMSRDVTLPNRKEKACERLRQVAYSICPLGVHFTYSLMIGFMVNIFIHEDDLFNKVQNVSGFIDCLDAVLECFASVLNICSKNGDLIIVPDNTSYWSLGSYSMWNILLVLYQQSFPSFYLPLSTKRACVIAHMLPFVLVSMFQRLLGKVISGLLNNILFLSLIISSPMLTLGLWIGLWSVMISVIAVVITFYVGYISDRHENAVRVMDISSFCLPIVMALGVLVLSILYEK